MSDHTNYALPNRSMISLAGADAMPWLDNLVTNDLTEIKKKHLVFSALLSPQGKIQFEFFVHEAPDGVLLETARDCAGALMKRLSVFKLRAQVELVDVSSDWVVLWGRPGNPSPAAAQHPDPRAPGDLWRGVCPALAWRGDGPAGPYLAERVRLGLAEAPDDYALGDTFPHEANYDLRDGVSFTKGCFIGQEVVARMQNKAVVRKRVVGVKASGAALASGMEITAGPAVIGTLGSVFGHAGLAMVRLDRAVEALANGLPITAGGTPIVVDAAALDRYRASAANRPAHDL